MDNKNVYSDNDLQKLERHNLELERAVDYYKKLADEVAGHNIIVDAQLYLTKRELELKKDGFSLLLALHEVIGSHFELDSFFRSTLEKIVTALKMDRAVMLWKNNSTDKEFMIKWHLGYNSEELEALEKRQLNLDSLNQQDNPRLLVNRATKMNALQEELGNAIGLPFYIGVPVCNKKEILGWLIAGRERESMPFSLPLQTGDLETFIIIAGFIEAAISNLELYNKIEKANLDLEEYNKVLEKKVLERTKAFEVSNLELEEEKKKADELLLNILPAEIANELKRYGISKAKRYNEVTIMFTDFVNFSHFAERLTPEELVAELDKCFRAFDEIISRHGLEKIKTIGDAYMCIGGLPNPNVKPGDVIRAALEMRDFIKTFSAQRIGYDKSPLSMRVGLHYGPVIAGVVGLKKFSFDIWGDTVNIASRMESSSEADKVNVSDALYQLTKDEFAFESRGKVKIKNKGEMETYFVEERK